MILFINACVRQESRTKRLADCYLGKCEDTITELCLNEISFPKADEDFLKKRDQLLAEGKVEAPMFDLANQFARADEIVIAAPYWDLSFPAMLKQYLEQICAVGITFRYTPEGIPEGLCRAKTLYYAETAGGPYAPEAFGFGYVQALCRNYFGISDTRLVRALGLDVDGADVNGILRRAVEDLDAVINKGGETQCLH